MSALILLANVPLARAETLISRAQGGLEKPPTPLVGGQVKSHWEGLTCWLGGLPVRPPRKRGAGRGGFPTRRCVGDGASLRTAQAPADIFRERVSRRVYVTVVSF